MAKKAGRPRKAPDEPQVTNSEPAGDTTATGTVTEETPKRGRGRAKQQMLDDPAFQHISEIEVVANDYVAARDARQALLADEVNFKKRLIEVMKKHELENYSFNGYIFQYEHIDEEDIKVKKARAAKPDGSLA